MNKNKEETETGDEFLSNLTGTRTRRNDDGDIDGCSCLFDILHACTPACKDCKIFDRCFKVSLLKGLRELSYAVQEDKK